MKLLEWLDQENDRRLAAGDQPLTRADLAHELRVAYQHLGAVLAGRLPASAIFRRLVQLYTDGAVSEEDWPRISDPPRDRIRRARARASAAR